MPRPAPDEAWWWVIPVAAVEGAAVAASDAARIARITRADERARAVAASVLLRRAVSWAIGVPADDVTVERRCRRCDGHGHGKPSFPGTGIEASASRSGPFVAVAVAARPVGIDIEALAQAAPGAWLPADWVRVESVLKATGDGVAVEPGSVSFASDGPVHRVTGYAGTLLAATTTDLALGAEAVGAVTLLGSGTPALRRGDAHDLAP